MNVEKDELYRKHFPDPGVPKLPCADQADWNAWCYYHTRLMNHKINSKIDYRHDFCQDCSLAYQKKMISQGKCGNPKIIFVDLFKDGYKKGLLITSYLYLKMQRENRLLELYTIWRTKLTQLVSYNLDTEIDHAYLVKLRDALIKKGKQNVK